MKRFFVFLLGILFVGIFASTTYAAATLTLDPDPICQDIEKYTLTFNGSFETKEDYTYALWKPNTNPNSDSPTLLKWKKPVSKDIYISDNIFIAGELEKIGQWHYELFLGGGITVLQEQSRLIASGDYTLYPKESCELGVTILEMPSPIKISSTVLIKVRNINPDSDYLLWFVDEQVFNNGKFPASAIIDEKYTDKRGEEKNIKTASLSVLLENKPGSKTLCLKHGKTNFFGFGKDNCEVSIPITVTPDDPEVTSTIIKSGELTDSLKEARLFSDSSNVSKFPSYVDPAYSGKCPYQENQSEEGCVSVKTAVGSISTNPPEFVKSIFTLVLGLAGGIALILIIIAGYRFMASQGDPEKIVEARQQLIAAIVGLLFIIFSFVILQVIGVDILRIPGFNP